MRFRWTLFGKEITTLEWGDEILCELDEITGGSCHDFERDGEPLDPQDRYRFGFE